MTVVDDVLEGAYEGKPDQREALKAACFDMTGESIVVQDGNGQILALNEAAARLFSVERSEDDDQELSVDRLYASYRVRTAADERVPEDEHPAVVARQRTAYSGRDLKLIHRNTGDWWIGRFRGQPVVDHRDEQQIYVTTIRDITKQRVTKEKIRRSNRRLRLLSDSTAELLLSDDPLAFLEKLYQRLSDELGLEVYFHFRVSAEGDGLELAAAQGVSDETARELRHINLGTAVCGRVAQTCSPIVAEHVQQSSEERTSLIRRLGITAYVCHPLVARGRLLGTLSFGTRSTDTFDEDTVDLIRTVCDQVAAVIERQQTREALRQSREELRAMNQTLEKQVQDRTSQVRRLSQELTIAEREERRRIGQNLHDGVSSQLSGITLVLGSLVNKAADDYPELADSLRQVKSLVQESGRDVQRIARGLHPTRLEESGLADALNRLVSDLVTSDEVDCHFECDDNVPELSTDTATHLYWIAQEAVANARKYADADGIRVSLRREGQQLHLTVADDGKGLPEDHQNSDGLGLNTMHNRAQLIGGQLEIETTPGEGTRVICRMPLGG